MSLYRNPNLADRVRQIGVVDRFIRLIDGTYEQVLTLSITTSAEGIVVANLSCDLVVDGTVTTATTQISVYPVSQQPHAQEDALLLSRKWGLTLRAATPGVGWTIVRNADAPDSTDGASIIIGA